MILRDMVPEDLDQIMEMEKRVIKPWERYSFGQAARLGHWVGVVERDGQILGYGVANGGHGRHFCSSHANAAMMMYTHWKKVALEKKSEVLWAETHRDSVESIAMLMKLGFTVQGVRPSYYGPGEDATVWARPNLTQASTRVHGRPDVQPIDPA
jgi:ribosomal protein S18 acetylase RimI-like enzyme